MKNVNTATMNNSTLAADASALGLSVSHGDGRVRLSGRIGAVKKVFAMQGLSAEKAPNNTGWYILDGDDAPVASICADLAGHDDHAVAFTFGARYDNVRYIG